MKTKIPASTLKQVSAAFEKAEKDRAQLSTIPQPPSSNAIRRHEIVKLQVEVVALRAVVGVLADAVANKQRDDGLPPRSMIAQFSERCQTALAPLASESLRREAIERVNEILKVVRYGKEPGAH